MQTRSSIVRPILTSISLAISALAAQAAPLSLTQSPPGVATEPAPNIILSVDDSGSMGWDINGCRTPDANVGFNEPGATGCPAASTNPNPSRIRSLRNALINTFGDPNIGTKGIVDDDRIRLGWQTMWDNGRATRPTGQRNDQDLLTAGAVNSIKSFTGNHRINFNNFLNSLDAERGTPSHKMMSNVRNYMLATGMNSPFADFPGQAGTSFQSCRRTYHVFMTDGSWNSQDEGNPANLGNFDGTDRTLPDNTRYEATGQTRVYRDAHGGTRGTIADWAFANWATDFQTSLANDARSLLRVATPERVGATTLAPYWNPKNNPMTWQGVTQYSIGYGNAATTWPGSPTWDNATDNMYGGDFSALVNGTRGWQDLLNVSENRRPSDLWHMALNGRGKYFPARDETSLTTAFESIFKDILEQTSSPLVSIATSSSRLRSDGLVYIAGFDSENWNGQLGAYSISATTNAVSPTPNWNVTDLLDASGFSVANRVVLTNDGSNGRSFEWANLSAAQRISIRGTATVNAATDLDGSQTMAYLRGERGLEQQNGGSRRDRVSRLGNIVNSNIWLTARPGRLSFEHAGHSSFRTANASLASMLFVGANDGMLHAFNATNGAERLAYVPLGAYTNLRSYTQPTYSHRYFVDGHPFTGDADVSGSGTGNGAAINWKTILIGSMGLGGKGYFGLDVSDPTLFVSPGTGTSNIVLFDKTAPDNTGMDLDIGHIVSFPVVDPITGGRSEQIVKLNDGRWAAVMGNGINSTNERPVLLIQYLDGLRELRTIVASSATGTGNGLSAPRLIDVNGDGKMDIAYAGDIQGNLWKFNMGATTPSLWSAGFSGTPLYKALDATSPIPNRQPITAAPLWMANPNGGIQVLFGTGINVTDADPTSTRIQTVYSVWDRSTYNLANLTTSGISIVETFTPTPGNTMTTAITGGRSALVKQSVVSTVTRTVAGTAANTDFFNTTENNVPYTGASAKSGWYFDLPASRERMLNNPQIFEGQKVILPTTAPKIGATGETCDLSASVEDNWINVMNMISGKPAATPAFSSPDASMDLTKATRTRFGSGEYILVDGPSRGVNLISINSDPSSCPPGQVCTEERPLTTGNVAGARADWREVR
jgi:type IV pilus assembly protein PilY1